MIHSVPEIAQLLKSAAAKGHNLGSITHTLLQLLERYGIAPMRVAVAEALARDVPHPNAVRLALERGREARNQSVPVVPMLSERARALDVTVLPHELGGYDELIPPKADAELDTDTDSKEKDEKS